jgi:hypothetical protein
MTRKSPATTTCRGATLDEIERIAKLWFETPCPPEEGPCNTWLHNWDTAHPDDKAHAMGFVAFVLANRD